MKMSDFHRLHVVARKRLQTDSGAQFLEYAMLGALIGIGAGAAVMLFGKALLELLGKLTGVFTK